MSTSNPLSSQCTATSKSSGRRCPQWVVGGGVCFHHGGAAKHVAAKREERVVAMEAQAEISAWSALTGRPTVDPGLAVLAALQMSWLRLHVYSGLLEQQLRDDDGVTFLRPNDGGPKITRGFADAQPSAEGTSGLIGHTFSADKQAGIFASGEAVRALVTLEAQERDRVVRYAKTAHDMGIAEREVRLAEQQGQLLADVINGVLAEVGLTQEQLDRAPEVITKHLMAVVEATGGDAS